MGNIFRRNQSQALQQLSLDKSKNMHQQADLNIEQAPNYQQQQQSNTKINRLYIKLSSEINKSQVQALSKNPAYNYLAKNSAWFLNFIKHQQLVQEYQPNWKHVYRDMISALKAIRQCVGVKSLKIFFTPDRVDDVSGCISSICFVSLKTLVLSNNKLQSIQFIQYLFTPNLQQLNLNGNNLTSLKPLRKLSTSGRTNLQLLHIHNNRLASLNPCQSHITSLPFNTSISTQCLNLQQTSKLYYGDDINWLFKLPCPSVFRLEIDGSGRIPVNRRKFNMIRSRFRSGQDGFFMWGPKVGAYYQNTHHNRF